MTAAFELALQSLQAETPTCLDLYFFFFFYRFVVPIFIFNIIFIIIHYHSQLVFFPKAFKEQVESHGFNSTGGYSYVDVDHVDFIKFPNLQDISWHKVSVQKGDCIFIPRGYVRNIRQYLFFHYKQKYCVPLRIENLNYM